MEHAWADVNGIRLHYVTEGRGPLIVFLHGFPEFWYEWRRQLAEFGRDHQAVAPDMRGYNLSSKPAALEQYRIKHLVDDLGALAEHLGAARFVLVAHDWGGVSHGRSRWRIPSAWRSSSSSTRRIPASSSARSGRTRSSRRRATTC
jgi:pimeloyl-ACP methyl ester carboxylesterase